MGVGHLIGEEEHLHASYEYDAEYVEGKIVRRPTPAHDHSEM
jgi:hypothetical protein